jgi:Excalibur calcium-binding domain
VRLSEPGAAFGPKVTAHRKVEGHTASQPPSNCSDTYAQRAGDAVAAVERYGETARMRAALRLFVAFAIASTALLAIGSQGAGALTCAEIGHRVYVGDPLYSRSLDRDGDGIGCEGYPEPPGGPPAQPPAPPPTPPPPPPAVPPNPAPPQPMATCDEIGHPVVQGDPAYRPDLDADNDGIGCEGYPSAPGGPVVCPAVDRPLIAQTKGTGSGYWMLDEGGWIYAFGEATAFPNSKVALCSLGFTAVKLLATPDGKGAWILSDAGVVYTAGTATSYGDLVTSGQQFVAGETAATMSSTPTGSGYWIFTTVGRAVAFGDATHMGDMFGIPLNGPVVDSISLPDGSGYYMLGSDGGVFSFGQAQFYGSMGGKHLNEPVNGLVPDPDGEGYWLVASDGGVFAFEAGFVGSLPGVLAPGVRLNAPINGMVAYGEGYLMVASDGGIFNFSDRDFVGALGGLAIPVPIVSVAALPT